MQNPQTLFIIGAGYGIDEGVTADVMSTARIIHPYGSGFRSGFQSTVQTWNL
jgi:hypothetical protein